MSNQLFKNLPHTSSVGGVIVTPDHQCVLVQHKKSGSFGFPKGHIEDKEQIYDTLGREIREETGLDPQHLLFKGFLPQYERLSGIKNEIKTILLAVLYLPEKKELNPHDSDIETALYVGFGEVSKKLTHIEDSEFFAQHRPDIQTMLRNIL